MLTPASLALFLELADDAANWGGNPPTDGNLTMSAEQRGNLTQLKKAGLVKTSKAGKTTYVHFTEAGEALAEAHDISIY